MNVTGVIETRLYRDWKKKNEKWSILSSMSAEGWKVGKTIVKFCSFVSHVGQSDSFSFCLFLWNSSSHSFEIEIPML